MQNSRIALSALAISASAACQPPDAASDAAAREAAPVVGRLLTRDGVIDLNVRSFADMQGPVPTSSFAQLMADVANKGSVEDARSATPNGALREDQDQNRDPERFLRRAF
jgi:hypothetical protein